MTLPLWLAVLLFALAWFGLSCAFGVLWHFMWRDVDVEYDDGWMPPCPCDEQEEPCLECAKANGIMTQEWIKELTR